MLRSTLMALAIVCVLGCASYAQEPAPSASPAGNQSAAPAPAATPMQPRAPVSAPAPATLPSTSVVPMSEAVITLKGACQPAAGAAAPPPNCVSSVTRESFEKLIKAVTSPERPMPVETMRNFATQYAKVLTFSDAACALGLENDPRVLQIMQYVQKQVLTEALIGHVTEEYSHPTDQQIEDYYNQNKKRYVEATLQRIVIPRNPGSGEKPKPSDAEEKAYADQIQKRWVAGEDPEKLEKEATDHADLKTPPANVNLGARRPGTLPEAHESAFELKPGEVSVVFTDPAAFYAYKVVSVRDIPLSEAKAEITTKLQRQLVTDKIQQIQSSVTPVLNNTYFGPEKAQVQPTPRTVNPRRAMPPTPGAGAPPQPGPGTPPPNPGNAPPQQPPAPPQ
jgi:PPIC-type PPIASE domain